MGQKVHPIGFRLGINRTWDSRWFSRKEYPKLLHEDLHIRSYLKRNLAHAGISRIEIERAAERAKVNIYTSRPAIIIGKKGTEVDRIKKEIQALTKRTDKEIFINIKEVRNAEIDSQLVAENVALQLERRVAFRRVMKKAISSALRFGAKGIKIACAGRLAGAEMARREWYLEGRVPLHTIRAQIDYGFAEAKTTYGQIGVKVWIYKGDSLELEVSDTVSTEERAPKRMKSDRRSGAFADGEKKVRRRRRARKLDSEITADNDDSGNDLTDQRNRPGKRMESQQDKKPAQFPAAAREKKVENRSDEKGHDTGAQKNNGPLSESDQNDENNISPNN
ncbi:MAG: 30S ribosomal protein S3 [Candidatus Schekmanbacteria bacterium RBG_13_48_7]|uniref:Small ribosomal subunit protein uS3 n=1 Tax=Candidatus Schekmanbacteria bacterium RBG_13_48_7 TaxID=1817878 RepID=A0A1F7S1Y8_9BACT|nr:MAG: 30S ribosomal protein S3 [Candidatus Schekmanbacteria bacterium RBG_13_48_7]